jgi:hypothetical protein
MKMHDLLKAITFKSQDIAPGTTKLIATLEVHESVTFKQCEDFDAELELAKKIAVEKLLGQIYENRRHRLNAAAIELLKHSIPSGPGYDVAKDELLTLARYQQPMP